MDGSQLARAANVGLTIVMPVYNEERTILQAVHRVLEVDYPCPAELVVVNDGSTDGTPALLDPLNEHSLSIMNHPVNRGKGAAVQTGIEAAKGTYILIFDADLEYDAADIPMLLMPILRRRVEIVFGSRIHGNNTVYGSFRYAFGSWVTTCVANIVFNAYIKDLHTCLKLVPTDLLRRMNLRERGFGIDTEITAKLLRSGYRPFEVPISYNARTHEEGKKIRWQDGLVCVQILGRVRTSAPPRLPARPPIISLGPDAVSANPTLAQTSDVAATEVTT
jgi:glycosyltransferase involved in cell wall biosynthesis